MKKMIAVLLLIGITLSLSSCGFADWLIGLRANRTYTIHFNPNGGEGTMEDHLVESGDDGWLPKCKFTREGYDCVAWGLDPEGKKYATQIDNMTFRLPSSFKNGDTLELYAIWTTPGFSFEIEAMGFFVSASLTEYSGDASHVTVPAHYEGPSGSGYGSCHVAHFANGLFSGHKETITVKNIPASTISEDMFSGCTALENISMREGTTLYHIGKRAFYNCTSLKGLELSANLDTVGEEAFYNCTSIERLVIPAYLEELGDRAFYGWTEEQTIEFTRYAENPFGEKAFEGCNAKIIWSGKKSNNTP